MAKTRLRDEKFRLLLVRIPMERNPDLEAAAQEIGLKPTQFILMETLKALNTLRAAKNTETVPPQEQSATVNF